MGVNDAIRAYNGVITWINKNNFDLGEPKKKSHRGIDQHLNAIFRKFGQEHNIEMRKDNTPRYKGSFSPMMSNCIRIQDNWKEFKEWAENNLPKKVVGLK